MRRYIALVGVLLVVAGLAGCAQPQEEAPEKEAEATLVDEGESIYGAQCVGCHGASGEGVQGVGPAVKGLYNSEVELKDGSKVTANEEYIKESIVEPQAKVRKGFNPMTDLGVSEEDAEALTAYMKSLE